MAMNALDFNITPSSKGIRILYHVLFWVALYVLDVLIFGIGYENLDHFVTLVLAEVPPQVFLAYTVMYWIIPRYVKERHFYESLIWLFAAFFISGFVGHLCFFALNLYEPNTSVADLPKIFVRGFYAVLHASIFVAIKLIKMWYENERRVSEMEKTRLESELKMLRDQVNPHFMFNTLNNLYGLIGKNTQHAQESVLRLSRIMHHMLYESNHSRIPMHQEIRCIRDYIELEKLRYPGNLSISLNVQDEVHDLSIVPLTIFPFVENSFKHGASEMIDEAWINVDFSTFKNWFIFKIENGKGPTVAADAKGIGLNNVKRRLELIYGDDHSLHIIDGAETFLVILKISLSTMQKIEERQYESKMSYSRG
jgi:two-component system, LytTR family, sensor kinase